MTGVELRELRRRMGLGVVAFGKALGYLNASDGTLSRKVRRYEAFGAEPIPRTVAFRAVDAAARMSLASDETGD